MSDKPKFPPIIIQHPECGHITMGDEKDKDVAARTRFTYIGDVVNGLNQFEETLKFCLKPKNNDTPIRKQKRNDNQ